MSSKLWMGAGIELRWWWETPPAGRPVLPRDRQTARLYLARLGARPDLLRDLRRFLAEGSAGLRAPRGDGDLLEQLAIEIGRGSVQVAETPRETLPAWDVDARDEVAVERPPTRVEAPAVQEEICWPCLQRAASSARALREAASHGTPFVVQD